MRGQKGVKKEKKVNEKTTSCLKTGAAEYYSNKSAISITSFKFNRVQIIMIKKLCLCRYVRLIHFFSSCILKKYAVYFQEVTGKWEGLSVDKI